MIGVIVAAFLEIELVELLLVISIELVSLFGYVAFEVVDKVGKNMALVEDILIDTRLDSLVITEDELVILVTVVVIKTTLIVFLIVEETLLGIALDTLDIEMTLLSCIPVIMLANGSIGALLLSFDLELVLVPSKVLLFGAVVTGENLMNNKVGDGKALFINE